ncbi:ancient ubiquitous protein 1-like [Ostrinia furnacalis]|uniref:ancient ubiquitous protein 1-like n=1 Tax=Ostrinia furnacalis TaxID=93504 RepID=UPI00103F5A09|nr:ancient ubiquitous protein 1-like [Ostrinia furnacalis]
MVANCVSCLDALAASHVLGTISLKKWKVPPFFASTMGIRNAAQFVRKQHFGECASQPVLLQPEGGAANGRGVLRFTDWPCPLGNRVQPLAITVERPFTNVTVHRATDARDKFPWSDAWWFLWTPATVFSITLLPALERHDDDDAAFAARIRQTIADGLGVELAEYKWEELNAGGRAPRRREPPPELARLARQVKEVLPAVPMRDIMRDLATTRSVDVTITNFLEGVSPYTPEATPGPSAPRYVTPAPTGVFSTNARDRQLSFQERKANMIAEARRKYIEKHGLDAALC